MADSDTLPVDAVHTAAIGGIQVRTGDLICTTDGGSTLIAGQFWRAVGILIPGDVDHVAVYTGPGTRCVEAGAIGRVVAFTVPGGRWDAAAMLKARGFEDRLYGVADPTAGRGLDQARETSVRLAAANFCLEQARLGKPYNLNFGDADQDDTFYCSQLAYRAYLPHGIVLNTLRRISCIPASERIVFPQEVWDSCLVRRLTA